MISKLEDISINYLKDNHLDIYYFGLGFIQLKIDLEFRLHVYHPDLPAFIDKEPHDHRYHFTSKVLKGTMENILYEIINDSNGEYMVEYETCNTDIKLEDSVVIPNCDIKEVKRFKTEVGESYHIAKNDFHLIRPTYPCVTLLQRGQIETKYAKVIRKISDEKLCPFSLEINKDELWQLVEDGIRK